MSSTTSTEVERPGAEDHDRFFVEIDKVIGEIGFNLITITKIASAHLPTCKKQFGKGEMKRLRGIVAKIVLTDVELEKHVLEMRNTYLKNKYLKDNAISLERLQKDRANFARRITNAVNVLFASTQQVVDLNSQLLIDSIFGEENDEEEEEEEEEEEGEVSEDDGGGGGGGGNTNMNSSSSSSSSSSGSSSSSNGNNNSTSWTRTFLDSADGDDGDEDDEDDDDDDDDDNKPRVHKIYHGVFEYSYHNKFGVTYKEVQYLKKRISQASPGVKKFACADIENGKLQVMLTLLVLYVCFI
jgi:hypothetical protein